MTAAEFEALSLLLAGRPGAAREGARRVLVDGASTVQAARELGIHRAGIDRVLARVRKLQKGGCPTCGRSVQEGLAVPTENYSGPAYWVVTATSEHSWDLVDMGGRRVATYPNAERANKARKEFERAALRKYLKKGAAA